MSSFFNSTDTIIGPESNITSKSRVFICNSSVSKLLVMNLSAMGSEIITVAQIAIALDIELFLSSISTSLTRIAIGITIIPIQ